MSELKLITVDDRSYPHIERRSGLPLRSDTDLGAAREARDTAAKGFPVLLILSTGEERLYRREWAEVRAGGYAFRCKCPKCRLFRRFPRGAVWCTQCRQPGNLPGGKKERTTTAKSAAVSASNKLRRTKRTGGIGEE